LLIVDFPDRETEIAILDDHAAIALQSEKKIAQIRQLISEEILVQARALIDTIRLDKTILTYIVDLVRATRNDGDILYGASTRAADAIAAAVRVVAAFDGRSYGLPDDVQSIFIPALRHRIVLSPSAEIDGRTAEAVLDNIKNRIDAPR